MIRATTALVTALLAAPAAMATTWTLDNVTLDYDTSIGPVAAGTATGSFVTNAQGIPISADITIPQFPPTTVNGPSFLAYPAIDFTRVASYIPAYTGHLAVVGETPVSDTFLRVDTGVTSAGGIDYYFDLTFASSLSRPGTIAIALGLYSAPDQDGIVGTDARDGSFETDNAQDNFRGVTGGSVTAAQPGQAVPEPPGWAIIVSGLALMASRRAKQASAP